MAFCAFVPKTELHGSFYLTGLQALGAYSDSDCRRLISYSNTLQVREPSALGLRRSKRPRTGVLMANILAVLRTLTAN